VGTASLTLYFAVTYTVQRFVLQWRAQKLTDTGQQDASVPTARS
jgi:hypothetical protein